MQVSDDPRVGTELAGYRLSYEDAGNKDEVAECLLMLSATVPRDGRR